MRRSQLKWKAATEPQPKSTCAEFQRKLTAAAEPQPKPKAEKHKVPIASEKRPHTIVISDDSDGSACGNPLPCTLTSETIPSEHGAGTSSSLF